MNQNNDKVYKYYTVKRPPDIGTVPKDFVNVKSYGERKQVLQDGTQAGGEVTYNRKLTDNEISSYELLEFITEENKIEVLQDIQKLDKIYSMLVNTKFKDQNIDILTDKISDLVNKEIKKKMAKNNVSYQEYKETIDKSHIIELKKDEMIRFYADKIVYDCITDCSENNRIFSVDEYENNDFVVENFAEIVKRINLDEKVNDMEVDMDKKEIDFIFYLDYCPHYYEDDLDISIKERIEHLKGFKNYMYDWKTVTPSRWFRTNTREAIQGYYNDSCMSYENKDIVYNLLSEELNKIGFVDKYLDGYNVAINTENVDELINQLDERINELKLSLEEGEIENG